MPVWRCKLPWSYYGSGLEETGDSEQVRWIFFLVHSEKDRCHEETDTTITISQFSRTSLVGPAARSRVPHGTVIVWRGAAQYQLLPMRPRRAAPTWPIRASWSRARRAGA